MSLKTCALLFAMGLLLACSSGVPVSIANRSGQALRNVVISGPGFRQHVSSIPVGQTATLYVHPKGESGVAIAFDLGAKRSSYAEDGYFESEGYEVSITVDAAGKASVDSKLVPLLFRVVGRWKWQSS